MGNRLKKRMYPFHQKYYEISFISLEEEVKSYISNSRSLRFLAKVRIKSKKLAEGYIFWLDIKYDSCSEYL